MCSARQLLLDDIGYSAWANQCLLEGCSALTAEEIECNLRISHSSVLETLRHIYDGERVWLDCLLTTAEGGTWRLPSDPEPGVSELSLTTLQKIWPELWTGYRHWLEELAEIGVNTELIVQLPNGSDPCLRRWKILRHVLEHSTLHRGQVVGMIRMLGHQPPAIQRMDYYLTGEPATRTR
jgi:uncharacterized damage-inducible protein DinB